jgi:hypothetical protein
MFKGRSGYVRPLSSLLDESDLARVSLEHIDYHPRRPFSTAGGLDPARRQCPGDSAQAANAAFLNLLDNRSDIGRKAISGRAIGF